MRHLSVLLCALAFAVAGQAQPYPEVKHMSPRERSFYFEKGFPVQDYHFDHSQINENLALAWKLQRGIRTKRVIGGSTLALGTVLTVSGLLITVDKYNGSDPFSVIGGGLLTSMESTVKTACIVSGLTTATVGIALLGSTGKKARRIDEAMETARRLHMEMISPAPAVQGGKQH